MNTDKNINSFNKKESAGYEDMFKTVYEYSNENDIKQILSIHLN